MKNDTVTGVIKENIYDSFKCIADKCSMTCCKGWSIRVEQDDFNKWKANEEINYLCQQVTYGRQDDENVYHMKVDNCKTCVCLDENGLCEIVKKHGDYALSKTCAEFPRKKNKIAVLSQNETESQIFIEEYSVSGACPAVLQLIWALQNNSIVDIPEKYDGDKEYLMEYKIRNKIIDLLSYSKISLIDRIMLCSAFLHECLECEWEDDVYDCIEVYSDESNLYDTINYYEKEQYNASEAMMELLQTFYDVTQYYKEEDMYRPYLENISSIVERIDEDTDLSDMIKEWNDYKKDYSKYDEFMTNIMVAEVFSDCISDDLEYLIECFQSIVMEYIMTRLSLFLKGNKNYDKEELINYMSLYIRMIGHNVDGMSEYWEENFEDPVLDLEYLYILLH